MTTESVLGTTVWHISTRRLHTLQMRLNDIDPNQYDALCMVGGSGTLLDMVNNRHLHRVIRAMVKADKFVGAICYAVAALAYCRAEDSLQSVIYGKKVTGHNIKFDYTDSMETGFAGTDLIIPGAPYPLEYVLRDAVGSDGEYIGNYDSPNSVVYDYPFLTARSTQDSALFGHKFVEKLSLPDYGRDRIEVMDNLEAMAV
jgi:putative intracellular protease/amidase